MAVITNPCLEEWHEEYVIIQLLQKENIDRKEIKKRIRSIQNKRKDLCEPHSEDNYDKVIKVLKQRFIVDEHSRTLSLTGLGEWIAFSKLGDLFRRNVFVDLMCKKCTNRLEKVLCTPLPDTITHKAKGDFFMDIKCPVCGSVAPRWGVCSIADIKSFPRFYNQAIDELEHYLDKYEKLVAHRMEAGPL